MGFRVNFGFFQAALGRNKRQSELNNDAPLGARSPAPRLLTISNQNSVVNRTVNLSQGLSSALTLSGAVDMSAEYSHLPEFHTGMATAASIFGEAQFSALHNQLFQSRSFSMPGIGDRTEAITNTPPEEPNFAFPTASAFTDNPYQIYTDESPTQEELTQVRNAVLSIAKNFILTDPNASSDDLQAQVDSYLGEGASAVFDLKISDSNNSAQQLDLTQMNSLAGISTISVSQVQLTDLDPDQKATIITAAANAFDNFDLTSVKTTLVGPDIDAQLQSLNSLMGPYGSAAIEQLRESLSHPGQPSEAVQNFAQTALEMGLPDEVQGQVMNVLQNLLQIDSSVRNSYEQNPILDDFNLPFESGRYANAFSPSQIQQTESLTDDSNFLAQVIVPHK